MLIHYKAYRIEAVEQEADRWRAAISRLYGQPIKGAVPPGEHMVVTTSADCLGGNAAIEFSREPSTLTRSATAAIIPAAANHAIG